MDMNEIPAGRTINTEYCLRSKLTGELARLNDFEYIYEAGQGACHLVAGAPDSPFPPFSVDTAEKAAYALVVNTPVYNSNPERPSWDQLSWDDYEVVKVVTQVDTSPANVAAPFVFANPIDSWISSTDEARQFVDIPADLGRDTIRVLMVNVPKGETLATLQAKCKGQQIVVLGGYALHLHAFGVFELPPDLAERAPNSAVGIIAMEI